LIVLRSPTILRCWSLKFKLSDHQFLHQSNVFHHINNILSKSDDGDSEESFNISVQSGYEAISQVRPETRCSNSELWPPFLVVSDLL